MYIFQYFREGPADGVEGRFLAPAEHYRHFDKPGQSHHGSDEWREHIIKGYHPADFDISSFLITVSTQHARERSYDTAVETFGILCWREDGTAAWLERYQYVSQIVP